MVMVHEADLDLWVGDDEACVPPDRDGAPPGGWAAVIHACKTCHMKIVGYTGSLDPGHPEYLSALRQERHLALNLIDAPEPRFFRPELFVKALDFLSEWHSQGPVLVHCNGGMSRAPSLALVYLAQRVKVLRRGSYAEAREDFTRFYRGPYTPGPGIAAFLHVRWPELA
jgi:hypothetical protein